MKLKKIAVGKPNESNLETRSFLNDAVNIVSLVASCAAFGIFFRWMQYMSVFDEAGLADKRRSWSFILIGAIFVFAFLFNRVIKSLRKQRCFMSANFNRAFLAEGKIYSAIYYTLGFLMFAGGAIIILTSETHKETYLLIGLGALAILSGVAFAMNFYIATKTDSYPTDLQCYLAHIPVLFFAYWIIVIYKQNSINSTTWAYAIRLICCMVNMVAFSRVAGFCMNVPDMKKTMFWVMMGAVFSIMSIVDRGSGIGEIVIFATAGLMMLFYTWIIVMNLRQKEPELTMGTEDEGGFLRLK